MLNVLTLAISWEPEIRGIVVVLIAVAVLIGSVYLLLSTNMGIRLGLLTAFAALFGWMTIMGAVWWTYGIGLRGKDPTWQAVQVINGDLDQVDTNSVARDINDGWTQLGESDTGRGTAIAAADDILQNQAKRFKAGEYLPIAVYDKGGDDRKPVIFGVDFLAFFHGPHYALVEVQPVIPTPTEPGRAPPQPRADPNAQKTYVLMERNQGTRRRPAALITVGSAIIFGLTASALHRRDKLSQANRSQPATERVGAGV
jgi:hypothetical protein